MDSFKITTAPNGVATVWFDSPGKSVNTLGPHTLAELAEAVSELERTHPIGVIFASAKAQFHRRRRPVRDSRDGSVGHRKVPARRADSV